MGLFKKKEQQYYSPNEGTVVNHPTDMTGGWQAERFSDIEQNRAPEPEQPVMEQVPYVKEQPVMNQMPYVKEQPIQQKGQVEIGKSLVIEGTVASSDDLHIVGCVRGSVTGKEDIKVSGVVIGDIINARNVELCGGRIRGNIVCSGKLLIDEKSVTVGNVECASLRLDGKHKGNIKTEEDVVLGKNSMLLGNISSDNIFMEHGAYIDGRFKPRNEISTKEIFDLIGNSTDSSR